MATFDWQAFVFNPQAGWVDRLNWLARRRFPDSSLADEAFNFAFERITISDWELLSGYSAKAQPGTYLTAVFTRLLEDFARARFGRPRPPAWLARLGSFWRRVFQLLCVERLETGTIVDRLTAKQVREPQQVLEAIALIKAKVPGCGKHVGEVLVADPAAVAQDTPDEELARRELDELLGALRILLASPQQDGPRSASPAGRSLADRLPQLSVALEVSDEERLVLRLLFEDGRTVAAAARALGQPEHKVRRCYKRAVRRLREALSAEGIGAEMAEV